ncbi:MAG TPA: ribonuclease HI family protein [Candidatus Doudnabacteria bacterium]|nr:ribonuclease HI family protein [Candidatus Doudnabacteria bacterium]
MSQNSNSKKLFLSTDGGARGNPGPAALGFVITDESGAVVVERGRYLGETTNNVAEYSALIDGLTAALELGATEMVIKMDSELIVKQMSGEYKIKQPHLQELAKQVRALLAQFTTYRFEHVLREFNKAADAQVNIAIDEALGK